MSDGRHEIAEKPLPDGLRNLLRAISIVRSMSATLAKQFEGFAKCCLDLARSTKTATHRVRFVEMAHEYWLASLLIRNELSSDLSAGNAYHSAAPIGRATPLIPPALPHDTR